MLSRIKIEPPKNFDRNKSALEIGLLNSKCSEPACNMSGINEEGEDDNRHENSDDTQANFK